MKKDIKETLKEMYEKIDNGEDINSNKKIEKQKIEKQIESKPYIPKIAYYRYVKFTHGTQGTCDISEPLTDWKPLTKYSDEEMNEWNSKFFKESWSELKIEINLKKIIKTLDIII